MCSLVVVEGFQSLMFLGDVLTTVLRLYAQTLIVVDLTLIKCALFQTNICFKSVHGVTAGALTKGRAWSLLTTLGFLGLSLTFFGFHLFSIIFLRISGPDVLRRCSYDSSLTVV